MPCNDSDTVTLSRDVVDQAIKALRNAKVNAIAHYSNEPYPDDPRWSPWTRFGHRVVQRCDYSEKALRAALPGFQGRTPDE